MILRKKLELYGITDKNLDTFNDTFNLTERKMIHSTLQKKLELYGITDKNLAWFESYLSNRKRHIEIGENRKTGLKYVTCGVPKGSIYEPLLFLVYVNNLQMHLTY